MERKEYDLLVKKEVKDIFENTRSRFTELIYQEEINKAVYVVDKIIQNLEHLCVSHLGTYKNPKLSFYADVKDFMLTKVNTFKDYE